MLRLLVTVVESLEQKQEIAKSRRSQPPCSVAWAEGFNLSALPAPHHSDVCEQVYVWDDDMCGDKALVSK
jgi:hypothetical protein